MADSLPSIFRRKVDDFNHNDESGCSPLQNSLIEYHSRKGNKFTENEFSHDFDNGIIKMADGSFVCVPEQNEMAKYVLYKVNPPSEFYFEAAKPLFPEGTKLTFREKSYYARQRLFHRLKAAFTNPFSSDYSRQQVEKIHIDAAYEIKAALDDQNTGSIQRFILDQAYEPANLLCLIPIAGGATTVAKATGFLSRLRASIPVITHAMGVEGVSTLIMESVDPYKSTSEVMTEAGVNMAYAGVATASFATAGILGKALLPRIGKQPRKLKSGSKSKVSKSSEFPNEKVLIGGIPEPDDVAKAVTEIPSVAKSPVFIDIYPPVNKTALVDNSQLIRAGADQENILKGFADDWGFLKYGKYNFKNTPFTKDSHNHEYVKYFNLEGRDFKLNDDSVIINRINHYKLDKGLGSSYDLRFPDYKELSKSLFQGKSFESLNGDVIDIGVGGISHMNPRDNIYTKAAHINLDNILQNGVIYKATPAFEKNIVEAYHLLSPMNIGKTPFLADATVFKNHGGQHLFYSMTTRKINGTPVAHGCPRLGTNTSTFTFSHDREPNINISDWLENVNDKSWLPYDMSILHKDLQPNKFKVENLASGLIDNIEQARGGKDGYFIGLEDLAKETEKIMKAVPRHSTKAEIPESVTTAIYESLKMFDYMKVSGKGFNPVNFKNSNGDVLAEYPVFGDALGWLMKYLKIDGNTFAVAPFLLTTAGSVLQTSSYSSVTPGEYYEKIFELKPQDRKTPDNSYLNSLRPDIGSGHYTFSDKDFMTIYNTMKKERSSKKLTVIDDN